MQAKITTRLVKSFTPEAKPYEVFATDLHRPAGRVAATS